MIPQNERRAAATGMLLLLLLLIPPAVVQAQVWMGFRYTINNDGTVTITGYIGPGGAVTIPGTINGLLVTSIGEIAFAFCTSLTSVTIPYSVTNIGFGAFESCTSLTSVTIPSSVIGIGEGAFDSCSALTSVTIPNGVISIGMGAFGICTSLTSVTIPSSVTSIGAAAFTDCGSLTAITVDARNPVYSSVGGVVFDKNQTALVEYPAGKPGSSYTIPNGVTSIGGAAFYGCTSLTGVTVPDSVTSIGANAFYYCGSLTSVYFQGNAPSLGSDVFYGDNNATAYYLPGTTGWSDFSANTGLSVVLWNPHVQTSGASFGVRTNRFGFTITGTSNLVIVVEACTSLANPTWYPLATNTLTGGSAYFSDPQWANYPSRFYRLRAP